MSETRPTIWIASEKPLQDGTFQIREESPACRPQVALAYKRKDVTFIVRAVNCHDDLLAACKAARALLHRLGGTNHDPEYSELVAAIARAETKCQERGEE